MTHQKRSPHLWPEPAQQTCHRNGTHQPPHEQTLGLLSQQNQHPFLTESWPSCLILNQPENVQKPSRRISGTSWRTFVGFSAFLHSSTCNSCSCTGSRCSTISRKGGAPVHPHTRTGSSRSRLLPGAVETLLQTKPAASRRVSLLESWTLFPITSTTVTGADPCSRSPFCKKGTSLRRPSLTLEATTAAASTLIHRLSSVLSVRHLPIPDQPTWQSSPWRSPRFASQDGYFFAPKPEPALVPTTWPP